MASGFKINKQGILQFTRELEREFAKHPVRVPVEADPHGLKPALTVNNYNGPVVTVTGDHAQLAWDNSGTATQAQSRVEEIAPGYEDLAALSLICWRICPTSPSVQMRPKCGPRLKQSWARSRDPSPIRASSSVV